MSLTVQVKPKAIAVVLIPEDIAISDTSRDMRIADLVGTIFLRMLLLNGKNRVDDVYIFAFSDIIKNVKALFKEYFPFQFENYIFFYPLDKLDSDFKQTKVLLNSALDNKSLSPEKKVEEAEMHLLNFFKEMETVSQTVILGFILDHGEKSTVGNVVKIRYSTLLKAFCSTNSKNIVIFTDTCCSGAMSNYIDLIRYSNIARSKTESADQCINYVSLAQERIKKSGVDPILLGKFVSIVNLELTRKLSKLVEYSDKDFIRALSRLRNFVDFVNTIPSLENRNFLINDLVKSDDLANAWKIINKPGNKNILITDPKLCGKLLFNMNTQESDKTPKAYEFIETVEIINDLGLHNSSELFRICQIVDLFCQTSPAEKTAKKTNNVVEFKKIKNDITAILKSQIMDKENLWISELSDEDFQRIHDITDESYAFCAEYYPPPDVNVVSISSTITNRLSFLYKFNIRDDLTISIGCAAFAEICYILATAKAGDTLGDMLNDIKSQIARTEFISNSSNEWAHQEALISATNDAIFSTAIDSIFTIQEVKPKASTSQGRISMYDFMDTSIFCLSSDRHTSFFEIVGSIGFLAMACPCNNVNVSNDVIYRCIDFVPSTHSKSASESLNSEDISVPDPTDKKKEDDSTVDGSPSLLSGEKASFSEYDVPFGGKKTVLRFYDILNEEAKKHKCPPFVPVLRTIDLSYYENPNLARYTIVLRTLSFSFYTLRFFADTEMSLYLYLSQYFKDGECDTYQMFSDAWVKFEDEFNDLLNSGCAENND